MYVICNGTKIVKATTNIAISQALAVCLNALSLWPDSEMLFLLRGYGIISLNFGSVTSEVASS